MMFNLGQLNTPHAAIFFMHDALLHRLSVHHMLKGDVDVQVDVGDGCCTMVDCSLKLKPKAHGGSWGVVVVGA